MSNPFAVTASSGAGEVRVRTRGARRSSLFLSSLCAVLLAVACQAPVHAFGRNKLITRDFRWNVRSFDHFDIYYYDRQGENLLPHAERYLGDAYLRVSGFLPDMPEDDARFPFLLYNTHNDFEQTNVTSIGEGTGGVTEAFKDRFLAGHTGSQRFLRYVIIHEFTHEAEFRYLFSGFWRSLRVLKMIVYPNWLMEGLAEYATGDMDATTREMYLRDAALDRRLLPLEQLYSFNHVLPHQVTLAYKESEAFVRYIVEEYGRERLPELLRSYRNHLDADSVLLETLGIDQASLGRKFREYLEDKYSVLAEGLEEPPALGRQLSAAGAYPVFYESAVFSPDGRNIACIADRRGSREILLIDAVTGKTVDLKKFTSRPYVENVHADGRGLSFSPDGSALVFAGERAQRDFLYLCDVRTRSIREIDPRTETAASPVFSPDGRAVYFSGSKDGFRELFALSLADGSLRQLTSGYLDEIDASVSPDGRTLVFAAETEDENGRIEYDLHALDLESGARSVLLSLPGDERHPCLSPDGGRIFFTSDRDGVRDIYALHRDGNRIERLTRVIGGNFQPSLSPDAGTLLFSSFRHGSRHLYLMDLPAVPAGGSFEPAPPVMPVAAEPPTPGDPSRGVGKPSRFRASTDLFFPALFYSSLDGLFVATYWQVSDFFGDHQLQAMATYASAAEYLDYQMSYGFLRFRPQLYFTFKGSTYYNDIDMTVRRRDHLQALTVVYPLNRFQRLEFLLGTIDRSESHAGQPELGGRSRENAAGVSFFHDLTQGPYLEVTSGWRMRLTGEVSEEVLGGDYRYQNALGEIHHFLPLGRQHVLAMRALAGASFGRDAGSFRLGGEDRVRGVTSDHLVDGGQRLFVGTVEWRYPLVHNINYHLWFIFPDFFFKTLYGSLFVDAGLAWDEDIELKHIPLDRWKGSYGAGLRVHTFILQSYTMFLNIQVARRMDGPDTVLYLGTSTNF